MVTCSPVTPWGVDQMQMSGVVHASIYTLPYTSPRLCDTPKTTPPLSHIKSRLSYKCTHFEAFSSSYYCIIIGHWITQTPAIFQAENKQGNTGISASTQGHQNTWLVQLNVTVRRGQGAQVRNSQNNRQQAATAREGTSDHDLRTGKAPIQDHQNRGIKISKQRIVFAAAGRGSRKVKKETPENMPNGARTKRADCAMLCGDTPEKGQSVVTTGWPSEGVALAQGTLCWFHKYHGSGKYNCARADMWINVCGSGWVCARVGVGVGVGVPQAKKGVQ
uniref:Uncharacterized protein n=1 Tax=Eutreptiella gymnastica TaxID=73025 RepID=A0A7S4FQM0_9EUGL|mmetsp:Transcript_6142/g.9472  ORF Transcript_6142/g.9472 Transcript_6142/m.9472 type:complete len:276 (+) Transcript_6142:676-1503(+)